MTPIIIGIASGLLLILIFHFLKHFEKKIIYGLVLSGIGFLYVGFSWSNIASLIITAVQGIFFLLFAYYGIQKNLYVLASGYFIHGIWDIIYNIFQSSNLVPPHYDLFCIAIDWTIAVYLLLLKTKLESK